ncbi:MAG: lysyl oxidase family protein [Candidatus Limnocylindria bacterium]
MRSQRPIASLLTLTLALAVSVLAAPSAAVALDGSAVLPDLGMLAPKDFSIQTRPRGVRWLRFDSVVVNVGPGLFDVYGQGPADADGMLSVTQRVEDGAGGWTEVGTPARVFFAGDGHNHWHVENLQEWTIASVNDRATPLRRGAKTGFCFWDNFDYTATEPIVYHPSTTSACAQRVDGTVPMGLSVGWGDEYPSTIAFQYIDITGLPNGDYVVSLEVDLAGEFAEADELNNTGWATIRITRKSVTVLAIGTDLEP